MQNAARGSVASTADQRPAQGPSSTISAYLPTLKSRFQQTQDRLLAEVGALSRRGNLNLVIGSVTTVAAVVVLAYIAVNVNPDHIDDWKKYLPVYAVRLSVVVFVEIFSFFFLRLYRTSLMEIKYFQNELTNLEARFISLESAAVAGNVAAVRMILEQLARTERNFILKKGESTADLEKLRLDNEGVRDAVKNVSEAFTAFIKKSK